MTRRRSVRGTLLLSALGIALLAVGRLAARQVPSGSSQTGQTAPADGSMPAADVGRPADSDDEATQCAVEPFATVLARWKEILGQVRELHKRHKKLLATEQRSTGAGAEGFDPTGVRSAAAQSERQAIRGEFERLLQQGQELVPKLRQSAVAAYTLAPNSDHQLSRFLVKLVEDDLLLDDYKSAFELAGMMTRAGSKEPELLDYVGRAAFARHDFDTARKYLTAARDASGSSSFSELSLKTVEESQRLWKIEQEIRQKEAEAGDLPRVRLKTTKGDIVVELFENESPQTVGNFVSLVETGFYNGLSFHRVLPGFMAQAGCPKGDGTGGPGYTIYCECTLPNHRNHFRGSLSMAKAKEPNTGGSQFFLTFLPVPHLNGKHTVFGRVIEGMAVLTKLRRIDPSGEQARADVEPDKIVSAEVLRKRDHPYLPTKVTQ